LAYLLRFQIIDVKVLLILNLLTVAIPVLTMAIIGYTIGDMFLFKTRKHI